jgi:HEPN domain-containing protein
MVSGQGNRYHPLATRQWLRKAEADYQLAAQIVRGNQPFHDQLSFLCQQSTEKYLKALLEELNFHVPKTHNLTLVLDRLLPHHSELISLRRGLKFLNLFAVEIRYPGENATKRQGQSAFSSP